VEALETLRAALRQLARLRDARRLARAHSGIGTTLQALGALDAAIEQFVAQLTDAQRRSDDWGRALALSNLAGAYLAAGECEEAATLCREGLQAGHDAPDILPNLHNNLGVALGRQGRYADAITHHDTAAALRMEQGNQVYALGSLLNGARCRAANGELDAAHAVASSAMAQAEERGCSHPRLYALSVLADIAERRGETVSAQGLLEQLIGDAGRTGHAELRTRGCRELSALHERQGRHAEALLYLKESLQQAARPGAANAARSMALRLARAQQRLDRTQRQAAPSVPSSGDSDGAADKSTAGSASLALNHRERQIVVLLVEGHDNVRIGAVLGLSRHTVRHHLGGLMAKLGARNRTEAAARALQLGIVGGSSRA
jgi:DNA-binding CsgD family transcriptional regulator